MPLTEIAVRKAKPGAKTTRLFDGGGLYLEVAPSGGKWWRLKYRFAEKEKRLSLGVYPEVSLKEARLKRDGARRLLASGIDPSEHRQQTKSRGSSRQRTASRRSRASGTPSFRRTGWTVIPARSCGASSATSFPGSVLGR